MHSPTRALRTHPFNLIEVILAMVIILVGVVSIMALFPAGQKASSNAIGQTSAGDAADQFLRYFSSKVKTRWAMTSALPLSKPGPAAEQNARWETVDGNGVFSGVKGVIFSYNDADGNAKFDYSATSTQRDESGLFRVVQRTSDNVEDFSGVLRVWRSAATYSSYESTGGSWTAHKPVPPDQGIVLNVEVSWPAELPYERRQKATYSSNVFRPSENVMTEVNGAFRLQESGRLKVTYHGSDAGWTSSLWMESPEEKEIFPSNQSTDQVTIVETDYNAGEEFNFYIKTKSPSLGTYEHYAWAPPLPEDSCLLRELSGALNINPSNSTNNELVIYNGDQVVVSRDDLKNADGMLDDGTFYEGPATSILVRPKGNGNQNTLMINDIAYTMLNKERYLIRADEMTVRIYNDHVKNDKAMGHWWLSVESAAGQVLIDGESHDRLCPLHPNNKADLIVNNIPFYDNAPERYSGAYHLESGNPYCLVTDLEPGRKWLLRFEDLPGNFSSIDWDYNDVVVSVELQVNDGVADSLASVPTSGDVVLDPDGQSNDWRVSLTKSDGSFLTDADLSAYEGSAIALWFRPGGTGIQTITVDGASYTVNNDQMISIAAADLDVKLWEEGGHWNATFSATDAFVTVMQ